MTDGGVYTSQYFIKRLGSGQAEQFYLNFSYHLDPLPGICSGKNAILSDGQGAPVVRIDWSVRQSSQLAIEKGVCPLVGECCSLSVVMRPTMSREGMILTRIAVDCRAWFAGKCRLNLSLRGLGNELVLLGQVH